MEHPRHRRGEEEEGGGKGDDAGQLLPHDADRPGSDHAPRHLVLGADGGDRGERPERQERTGEGEASGAGHAGEDEEEEKVRPPDDDPDPADGDGHCPDERGPGASGAEHGPGYRRRVGEPRGF